MTKVGDAIERARRRVAAKAARYLPDTGTLSIPGAATTDSYHEQTAGTPATVENLPCAYAALSAFERLGEAGVTSGADHKLQLPYFWDSAAVVVPPNATLTVNARGATPQMLFRVTGPLQSSDEVWLWVSAKLVQ